MQPDESPRHRPHTVLHHIPADGLHDRTGQSTGMQRLEAISARTVGSERLWMGETHVAPGTRSADHHHGHSESAIHVLKGHPVFVFMENGAEKSIQTSPGDYIYVPPYLPHREENPSTDEEAVVVLARSTQEAIIVNLESLAWDERATDATPSKETVTGSS
jgi:uncharacterized RmlC-like cupin family protein